MSPGIINSAEEITSVIIIWSDSMLKLIRENYLDRAEAFASATGLPPELIRNFLSEDGKKSPYEIARRISSHFGESPECMCREADVDDFLPLRKKKSSRGF